MWNLPGGTVRFGERLVDVVRRVAADELWVSVRVGSLVGYIEYPSHYENGLDSPVGLVFRAGPLDQPQSHGRWFTASPRTCTRSRRCFCSVTRLSRWPASSNQYVPRPA
jgi:8-oxo-dGTP diphosphatase